MTPTATTTGDVGSGVVPAFIYARHRGDTTTAPDPVSVLSEENLEPAQPNPTPTAPDFTIGLDLYRDPAPTPVPDTTRSPATRSHDDTAPIELIKRADFQAPPPSAVLPMNAPAIPNDIALLAPGLTATWHYTHHTSILETSV